METQKPKSLLEMVKEDSLSPIEPSELLDICVNKGILQEANRTFFNPLGLALQLDDDGKLKLMQSSREAGPAIEMIDRMQLMAYRNWAAIKNAIRQKFYGFVIQTSDLLRADQMKQSVVSANTLRLNLLLNQFDQAAYECKQKIMRSSAEKDNDLKPMSYHYLLGALHEHLGSMNWVDTMSYAAMLLRHEDINKGLAKITPTETIDG
jgi:hypothetical protein